MKKTVQLSLITLILALAVERSFATIVTFTFSGYLSFNNDPFNTFPAATNGAPFKGSVTYDTAKVVNDSDSNSSTNEGDYYFSKGSGYSIAVTVAGHTFSSAPHTNVLPWAYALVMDNNPNFDRFQTGDGPKFLLDGAALPAGSTACYISLQLEDTNMHAYSMDVLPTSPPILSSFHGNQRMDLMATDDSNTLTFGFTGTVTNITPIGGPALSIKTLPNKSVTLSWPISYQGYGLMQSTNVAYKIAWKTNTTPVIDTAQEHTVTIPATNKALAFRLMSM